MPETTEWYELLQYGAKGRPRLWRIRVEGDTIYTEQGVDGGVMTPTSDIPGPKNKPGSKNYITAEEQAILEMDRAIDSKMRKGYVVRGEESVTEVNLRGPQPSCLRFTKPVNNYTFDQMAAQLAGGEGIWTTKKNGFCYYVTRAGMNIYIQTRDKMHDHAAKFPHLVKELYDLIPGRSIALMEITMGAGETEADRKLMQAIANSHVPETLRKQEELGWARGYIFRIPFWEGKHIEGVMTCEEWLDFVAGIGETTHISPVEFFRGTLEHAQEVIATSSWEGCVGYVPHRVLGAAGYNFKGTEDRPEFCWKLKQAQIQGGKAGEDDFVGYWDPTGRAQHCGSSCHYKSLGDASESTRSGRCLICNKALVPDGSYGSGANMNRVGSIALYQTDRGGVDHYICDVGGGLTHKQREALADPSKYPIVLQVKYDARGYVRRGDASNALTNPRIMSIRTDKSPDEVINPDL